MERLSRPARRRFSVADVQAMVATGILAEDERIELLDGELLVVSPQGPGHAAMSEGIRAALVEVLGPGVHGRTHSPLIAGACDLPEPDVAIVRGSFRDYFGGHPRGEDAVLVVEIAHSSLARDRLKMPIYAGAGVPEYWIVDLVASQVEVHRRPSPDGYLESRVYGRTETIILATAEVEVTSLLP